MIMFEFECELFFSSLHYVTVGRNLEFICTCFFSSFFIAWDQASQWGKKENTGYLSAEASNVINDPKCNKGPKCNNFWP